MSSSRLDDIDQLKGLLIILVLFGHITYIGTFSSEFQIVKEFVYIFHMPVFLIISGAFFKAIKNLEGFKKLLFSLVIPYFIFFTSYLVVLYFATSYGHFNTSNSIDSLRSIGYYLFIEPLASYWYLHSLIIFYLSFSLFPFILSKVFSKKTSHFLSAIIIMSLIWYLQSVGVKVRLWVFFYFFVGYFFGRVLFDRNRRDGLFFVLSVVTIFFVSSEFTFYEIIDLPVFRLIFSICFLFIALYIFRAMEFRFRFYFLSCLGRGSVVFFLLHVYPINLTKVISGFFINLEPTGTIYLAFSLFFSFAFCFLFLIVSDYLTISRFLFGRSDMTKFILLK